MLSPGGKELREVVLMGDRIDKISILVAIRTCRPGRSVGFRGSNKILSVNLKLCLYFQEENSIY